jgi:hypothetical protein
VLQVRFNQLKWLPAELGQLPELTRLYVRPWVLSISFPDSSSFLQLNGNQLPPIAEQSALRVNEIIAAMTHIGMIRKRATEICVALQDLELPAFVTLTIIDAAVHENSIRMWAKWELITAVKHFRDRRGIEGAAANSGAFPFGAAVSLSSPVSVAPPPSAVDSLRRKRPQSGGTNSAFTTGVGAQQFSFGGGGGTAAAMPAPVAGASAFESAAAGNGVTSNVFAFRPTAGAGRRGGRRR